MNLNDFLPKTTVAEVAMNPTAYAQSTEQAQAEGVLVGFEFEVCVPKATIEAAAEQQRAGQPTQTITPQRIKQILNNRPYIFNNASLDDLNRLLKPKETSRFPTINDAFQNMSERNLAKTRELLAEIPADLLSEYKRLAKAKIARQARNGTADLDTPEKREQAVARDIMQRYSGYLHYGMPDANNARRVVQELQASTVGPGLHNALKVMWPRIRNTDNIFKNLDRYFEYNPTELYDTFNMRRFDPTLSYDERNAGGSRGGFAGAAQALKPALESTMDAKVNVFTSYHQRAKNMTDWYIEPDGSLEPNSGDGAAEVVGPPESPNKAIDSLKKFFGMAQQMNLYTSKANNTGLHINVSIPKNLDILKLAVFLGDQYVLKSFGRENNSYAQSVMKDLSRPGSRKVTSTVPVAEDFKNPTQTKIDFAKLDQIARDVSGNHFASISDNGKYISFRHAGGDYLKDYTEILNVVGRFVRGMVIAADPTAYRNEYLKAVAKLVGQREPADATNNSAYIEDIKQNGLIQKTVYMYVRPEKIVDPDVSAFTEILKVRNKLIPDINYNVFVGHPTAKRELVEHSRAESRARREMTAPETSDIKQFATAVVYPLTQQQANNEARATYRGVDLLGYNYETVGYQRTIITRLAATDPRVTKFIRQLTMLDRGRV